MKITINHDELAEVESLLPESVQTLISVLGYASTLRLIDAAGGTTLTRKTCERRDRTLGARLLLVDILTADEIDLLNKTIGASSFYIPRCDIALRALRNIRFLKAIAEQQQAGRSLRQAIAALCPQYGICDRQAWKLIKERNDRVSPVQHGLF